MQEITYALWASPGSLQGDSSHRRFAVYVEGFLMTRDGETGKASQCVHFMIASPVRDSPGYCHMSCWENPTWPPVWFLGELNSPRVASPAIHGESVICPPRNVSGCLSILPTNYTQRLSPSSGPSPWPQSFRISRWDQDSRVYRTWPQRSQIQPCLPFLPTKLSHLTKT